jgi:hypothetical protein
MPHLAPAFSGCQSQSRVFLRLRSVFRRAYNRGMDTDLLKYLTASERETLAETDTLRKKSRLDALYYGSIIRQLCDRARSRRALKIKRETPDGH